MNITAAMMHAKIVRATREHHYCSNIVHKNNDKHALTLIRRGVLHALK
jgi:hypothetical protein